MALNYTDELCQGVERVDVTRRDWKRQRAMYQRSDDFEI